MPVTLGSRIEMIELGRSDAARRLRLPPGPEGPWQVEPLQAFIEPQLAEA